MSQMPQETAIPEYYENSAFDTSGLYETSTLYGGASHGSPDAHGAGQEIVKGTSLFALVKSQLDDVAARRKQGAEVEAEYEAVCREYPLCHLGWLEMSRYEMDQGCMLRCREVILRGLEYLPNNEALLEKRVKVEERLRNVEGVVACAETFLAMSSTRCVKSIVEAAIVVAKLGCGYQASALFAALLVGTFTRFLLRRVRGIRLWFYVRRPA